MTQLTPAEKKKKRTDEEERGLIALRDKQGLNEGIHRILDLVYQCFLPRKEAGLQKLFDGSGASPSILKYWAENNRADPEAAKGVLVHMSRHTSITNEEIEEILSSLPTQASTLKRTPLTRLAGRPPYLATGGVYGTMPFAKVKTYQSIWPVPQDITEEQKTTVNDFAALLRIVSHQAGIQESNAAEELPVHREHWNEVKQGKRIPSRAQLTKFLNFCKQEKLEAPLLEGEKLPLQLDAEGRFVNRDSTSALSETLTQRVVDALQANPPTSRRDMLLALHSEALAVIGKTPDDQAEILERPPSALRGPARGRS